MTLRAFSLRPTTARETLRALVRSRHFWIVVAMLAACTIAHYATPQNRVIPLAGITLTRHTIERVIFLLPVAAAAFAFEQAGGLITLAAAFLLMLPRVIFLSPQPADALIETLGVAVVGYLMVWMIEAQDRERRLRLKVVNELEVLNSIQATLCQSVHLDEMLQRALDKILEALGQLEKRGAVFIIDFLGQSLRMRAHRGLSPEHVQMDSEVPLGECLCGRAAQGGEVLVVANAVSDPRHTRCPEKSPHAHICVPIQSRERLLGAIDLYLADPEPVDQIDLALFVSVGRQIGVAVENALLYESLRFYLRQITGAQEDERQRIARELHDETAQGLIELSRRVDALAVNAAELDELAIERLEQLQERIEDLLQGVRRFSRDLRPSVLDDLGLLPALNGLLAELKEHAIEPRLETKGVSRRLPPDTELALFRIAQEALNNVKKHARASEVIASVEFQEARVRLTIQDNGCGFQFAGRTSDLVSMGRFGLVGMEERTHLLGGYLKVLSGLDFGTIVVADVPAPQG
jgi:signal transduction histidine kinase